MRILPMRAGRPVLTAVIKNLLLEGVDVLEKTCRLGSVPAGGSC